MQSKQAMQIHFVVALAMLLFVASHPTGVRGGCLHHGVPGGPGFVLYRNSTPIPVTWNYSLACPMFPQPALACCTKEQAAYLKNQLQVMDISFKNCPPCNYAIRAMWCQFTCGLTQTEHNIISDEAPDGQVLGVQLNITQSMAERVWRSCRNSVMGHYIVKVLFPTGIDGLLTTMADRSPTTVPGKHLISKIFVDVSWRPNASSELSTYRPLNISTIEERYACSQSSDTARKVDYYPLPTAAVGALRADRFVALIVAVLLCAIALLGVANRRVYPEAMFEGTIDPDDKRKVVVVDENADS